MTKVLRITNQVNASAIPKGDAIPDMSMEYATIGDIAGRGVSFAKGCVPSGGIVPAHASPNDYAMFVIAGSGVLTLHDEGDGKETGRVAFNAGDIIIFAPESSHGWINESASDFEWFGVDIAPS
ncbi:MAG: cupin domain-containing protein [Cognatishimia sp.]